MGKLGPREGKCNPKFAQAGAGQGLALVFGSQIWGPFCLSQRQAWAQEVKTKPSGCAAHVSDSRFPLRSAFSEKGPGTNLKQERV